ncbi:TPR-like protein [Boletus coccyginus]|nr:TPR-like protein [Boletus coccyginus]
MIPVVDWLKIIFGPQTWDKEDAQASLAHDMFKDAYLNFSHRLHSRAKSLATKFKEGGGRSYIEEAIELDREALQVCSPGHPERPDSLICLARHLLDRYQQFGGTSDFEEVGLSTRYEQLGQMADLDEAIVLNREALDLSPQGHPHHRLGSTEDLDKAIVLDREALDLRPQGHPDRSMPLCNLGLHLFTRYEQIGGMESLHEAIVLAREALDLCPQGHPDRSTCLNNLANDLAARYEQVWGREDLDKAIVLCREALDLCPQGHPGRWKSLISLANRLYIRFMWFGRMNGLYKPMVPGTMEDVDEAMVLGREALSLCPQGHPNRPISLSNLAVHLSTRYSRLGSMEDLDEAIVLDREALDLRQQGHRVRSIYLNLADYLSTRFMKLGAIKDLDEAIALAREPLKLTGKDTLMDPSG